MLCKQRISDPDLHPLDRRAIKRNTIVNSNRMRWYTSDEDCRRRPHVLGAGRNFGVSPTNITGLPGVKDWILPFVFPPTSGPEPPHDTRLGCPSVFDGGSS